MRPAQWVWVATALIIAGVHASPARAGTATAASSSVLGRPADASGTESWVVFTPTSATTISWSSGPNMTDGVIHPKIDYPAEPKFDTVPPPIVSRVFTGFARTDGPGPAGSTADTSGFGFSSVLTTINFPFSYTTYSADWTVVADGALGTGTQVPPAWASQAEGVDPEVLTSDTFASLGVTGTQFDLFIPVGLKAGSISSTAAGAMSLEVTYETATGSVNLLTMGVGTMGGFAISDSPAGLSYYQLDTVTDRPTDDPLRLVSLAGIESLLESDVLSDFVLDTPLYLGLTWEDLPIPTVPLSDGALARIYVSSRIIDSSIDPRPIGLSGDYNGNGLVEQGDLDLVLLNWGADARKLPAGWINDLPSGIVDQAELDGVLLNWGSGAARLAVAAVPEPATLLLATLLFAFALRWKSHGSPPNHPPRPRRQPPLFPDIRRSRLRASSRQTSCGLTAQNERLGC